MGGRQPEAASALFFRLIDDVRAGTSARGAAELYLARLASVGGDAASADRHRARAAQTLADDRVAKAS